MSRAGYLLALLAGLVLTAWAANAVCAEGADPHGLRSGQELLRQIKSYNTPSDKKCCKACMKSDTGKEKCKTFCGKSAHDKCEVFKGAGKKPQMKLEDYPCYPICRDRCLKTRGNLTWEQCIIDCLNRTRC